MGVYLSAPITEKVSVDKTCKNFVYGASSMQGWRRTQEDAHNCCPDYDPDKNGSLFAVYDGHGGAEVAQYAALHLPDFIKSLESYQDGNYRQALEEAFLQFDITLVQEKVIEELKALSGEDPGEEDDAAPEAVGRREADILCAEANMPLDELLAKYKSSPGQPFPTRDIRKKENILSPVIPNKHSFFERDNCTPDSPSGNRNNSNIVDFSASVVTNLQGKLSNGHAENENNLNTEKEMQNNQNPNWDSEKAGNSNTSQSPGIADSSTSQMEQKHGSKGPSVSSSSSTSPSTMKDFVSSSNIDQESSSSLHEAVCQSSCDVASVNNNVQNNSCSQSGSIKPKQEGSGEPPGSSDCPSSSSDIPKSSPVTADSSGSQSKAGGEADVKSSTERIGGSGRGDEISAGSGEASEPSSSSAQRKQPGERGDEPGGSGLSSSEVKPGGSSSDQPGGSAESSSDQPGGSAGSASDQPGGSGSSSDGPGSSSIEDEEPGGSGSGAGGSGSSGGVKLLAERPDLIAGDDSDDEDDDEYQEDSEEDYEDDDEDDEDDDEEEEGELEDSGFHSCVNMSNEEPGSDSGCTACLALLLGKDLWVANAGDSRCVLSRAGKAVEMSFDHKPEDDIERKRIEKAGGKVTSDGRVNGGLNLSRALGDHYYKRNEELPPEEQMITALPDIEHTTLSDDDEFVVIACDGIWNYMSSDDVISMVRQELKDPEKRKKPSLICEKMFNHCLAPNTFGDGTGCDNMTCIIIVLQPNEAEPHKRCASEMDSCTSTEEEGVAEKRTKLESDSPTSCTDSSV